MCIPVSVGSSASVLGGDQSHCVVPRTGVELQEVVSCLTWVLRIEPRASARAECPPNC